MTATIAPVVLPFRLRFGHVLLDARINDRPVNLVLDTGSGACCIDVDWGKEQRFAEGREAMAVGVDEVGIRLTKLESLNLGHGVELRDEIAALVPLHDFSAQHGRPVHGTIGFPLFSKYVVEVDYPARVVRLHDPQAFEYDGPGARSPLDLTRRVPVLDAELVGPGGVSLPARLLLDMGTGSYGALLTKSFVDRHSTLLNELPFTERRIGSGVGGAVYGHVTSVPAIRVAGLTAQEPIVALPSSARGFFGADWVDGTLGAAILRRARLILNYPRGEVIIEPEAGWDAPFEHDLSGLSFHAEGPAFESVMIDEVMAESAADAATLRVGDVVRSVDGRLVSGDSLDWLLQLLTVSGASYLFGVERDGVELELELTLRAQLLDGAADEGRGLTKGATK